jgi:hypothetical protein
VCGYGDSVENGKWWGMCSVWGVRVWVQRGGQDCVSDRVGKCV